MTATHSRINSHVGADQNPAHLKMCRNMSQSKESIPPQSRLFIAILLGNEYRVEPGDVDYLAGDAISRD